MNTCTFVGRLTDEPKVGEDRKGDSFASFTLAVQRRFDRQKADFIRCMAFGKPAEIIEDHCRKGLRLCVSGSLQIEDADNEYFGRATLMVDQFTLVEFEEDGGGDRQQSRSRDDRGGRDRGNSSGRGRDDRGGRSNDRGGRSSGRGRDDDRGRGRDDDRGRSSRGSDRDRRDDRDRNSGRGDDRGGSDRGNAPVGGPAPAEDEYDPFADE